jgi:uncharacterized protein (TIGR02594 family)
MNSIEKKPSRVKAAVLVMCSAAACSLVLVLATVSAEARPRHARITAAQLPGVLPMDNDGKPAFTSASGASLAQAKTPVSHRREAASVSVENIAGASFGYSGVVSAARGYIGTNPTGRSRLWCGAFMDMVLKQTGHNGGGNLARAYARYGTRVPGPQVGAIAVMSRKGGGHVGVVSGIDANGNPIIISGNHNHTVAETAYPRERITAYVIPN